MNENSGSENESLNGNENAYPPFEKKNFEPINNLQVMETTEYLRPRATRCSNTQSRSIHHTTILMSTRSNHITELLLQSGNDLFVTSIHLRQFRDCEFNTFVNNFIIPKRLSSQTYNERMSLQNGLNLFLQFFSVVRVCRETHFREELNGLRFK